MSEPRVLASAWIPLGRAAVCLNDDCETVFDVTEQTCPRCASAHCGLLTRWLTERAS